jgi:replicative DNA helicase
MSATLEASYIPELEQEVLGALLLSGEVKHVPGSLEPGHFIEPFHRDLFASMKQAAEQYSSVRLDLVRNVLAAAGDMDAIGKQLGIPVPEYLARLVGGTVRGAAGLKDSIPAMLHQWARFTVGREAERLLLASADPGTSPVELIRTAAHAFDDVSSTLRRGRQRKTLVSIGEASESAIAAVSEAMKHGAGLTGTTWGLADINRATGGMQAGEMIILGARPSMGKTAVALSIAIQAAKAGAGVGFISLEMAARSLALRALTDIAFDDNGRIAYSDLLTGRATEAEFERVVLAQRKLDALPLMIEDASGLSMSDIRAKVDRMAENAERAGTPLKVLAVDYLQLIAASSRYQGNRTGEITEISAGLRNLAREYNVVVLALSQLSRQVESREDKRPMLSDLRESGSIEQDADTVVFLFREAYYLGKSKGRNADEEAERVEQLAACQNKLEFIIAKQRMGATRTVDLFIDVASSAVRNAART